jgi:hypothetical protein
MAITNVKAFMCNIGSKDFPAVYSWDTPFGFEGTGTNPIYHYSLNDVRSAFIEPVTFLRNNPTESANNSTNIALIVESYGIPELKDKSLAIYQPDWTSIFKILAYVYDNQDLFNNGAGSYQYTNKGDEEMQNNTGPFYVSSYSPNSFEMMMTTNYTDRYAFFKFNATLGGSLVSFQVYLNPDYLIETQEARFSVYRYKDLNNDMVWVSPDSNTGGEGGYTHLQTISDNEFDSQIVNKITEILKEGKYGRYDKYVVLERQRKDPNGVGDMTVENTELVNVTFYVFSNYSASRLPSTTQLTNAVKNYLLNLYPGSDGMSSLIFLYPYLFTASRVDIIPIWTNNIPTGGNNVSGIVHPLYAGKLKEILTSKFGYQFDPSQIASFKPYEIFYVGATVANNYIFKFPLIAVEIGSSEGASGITYPISARFIDYSPKFGYDYDMQGSTFTAGERFHHFLLLALNLLSGILSSINEIPSDIRLTYGFEYHQGGSADGSGNVSDKSYCEFNYSNALWKVYGQN